ncbi:hypothetical protein CspeluHIS016_0105350 [Cutaneotrichosporon spelunceum]|uniref:Poly(A) RNA polymerase mitochondrial-like central palm domain-containing protein n=1 Tax=Cutaneotrichosporon spelunceum TaxID=1672016 RepID=A0AAD3Y9R6_9TREE|nr:hypothetical protein CspeluHIS016_0105350 [Cutaneotrichosporon spelunceum]
MAATHLTDEDPWLSSGIKYQGRGSAYARYSSLLSPRLNIPPGALEGSHLQWEIMTLWKKAESTELEKRRLNDLLQGLTAVLNRKATMDNPTGRRYIVDVFGSAAWGGRTGESSDVDLVIIDTHHPLGYEPQLWTTPPHLQVTTSPRRVNKNKNHKVPKIYNVHALKQYLHDSNFHDIKAIPAFTPIVKFTVGGHRLQCDICTNDLGGWYNSILILAYCEISPFVLRPMIHVLKLWLELHDLNDPAGNKGPRTMSSYCLTLMAIAYLQHLAVLPNLQSGVQGPASADPSYRGLKNTVWVSWGKEKGDAAHIWFERRPPAGWASAQPRLTAAEAVRGFFKFFSKARWGSFDPNTQFISVLNGGFPGNDRVGKCDRFQPTEWDDQLLIVQDPFLWQKNCAKTLFIDKQDGRFFQHITSSHRLLEDNPNLTLQQLLRT